MPVVSSQYWNMVHGSTPDEVRQVLEGMQVMRTLGENMAWLLRCIEAGRNAGVLGTGVRGASVDEFYPVIFSIFSVTNVLNYVKSGIIV